MRKKETKPTVPVKLTTWYNDRTSVQRLRGILNEVPLQQAIAILKEAAGPTVGALSPDPQVNSHRLAWYSGYRDAFNDLEKLATSPASTPNETPEEWTHIQTP